MRSVVNDLLGAAIQFGIKYVMKSCSALGPISHVFNAWVHSEQKPVSAGPYSGSKTPRCILNFSKCEHENLDDKSKRVSAAAL